MKHYLFVNGKGKKFKTTQTGRMQLMNNPSLKKSCKLLGECDEKGVLITELPEKAAASTVSTIKEIMERKQIPTQNETGKKQVSGGKNSKPEPETKRGKPKNA